MFDNIYTSIITFYNKEYKKGYFVRTYINPTSEVNQNYVLNTLPDCQKKEIYLIEDIEVKRGQLL